MKQAAVLFALLLCSCSEKPKSSTGNDFNDRVINLVTENPQDKYIELPNIYGKTVRFILDEKDDSSILAEKLKARGFKETARNTTDFPLLEKKMVNIILSDSKCECEVGKIYYDTAFEGEYAITERIKCEKIKNN